MRALMMLAAALALGAAGAPAQAANPYPTPVVAEYVMGCMAANGQNQDMLRRCSCSIDVIASILPYDRYEQAETVLSMRQVRGGGEKMGLFRETTVAKDAVTELRQAQVEAEVRCF
jgi:hypothetical protein